MSAVSLLFPHNLFEKNPALNPGRKVFLVEEFLFFNQYSFHKQKLVFHRASMKAYAASLQKKGYEVEYIDAQHEHSHIKKLVRHLAAQKATEIHCVEPTDFLLEKRLTETAARVDITLVKYESPLFLLTSNQVDEYFGKRKRFFQADFYTHQRKHFKILVDDKLNPIGGKWSFDSENRLKYPKGKTAPHVKFPSANEFWTEAKDYVETHFRSNYGKINDQFVFPTTFKESKAWLLQFFKVGFPEFGVYEDALVAGEHILHHSVLTPMLNVGLITPGQVIDEAIQFADENEIPLNSLEGFVRQILGWREFIRGVYHTKGVAERTTNYWKFRRKIPSSFWNGSTGIDPVDTTIKKLLDTAYCHHIERLMVLGNFMLLCEFDPDDVYKWFMEMFIDSYDWVMVPNIYGMSQFADGGLMATKPYISGSNYIMKMSNYQKGDWQVIWDALFWRFMHTHREFFLSNPRLSMLIKTFDKMPEEKRKQHLTTAEKYLKSLDSHEKR